MVYGDFSRLRIGAAHDFAAIWSQQGRVQLDSDVNAMMQILLDHLRTLTVDVLGPFAAGFPGDAFKIGLCDDDPGDLEVGTGDYYVHGLRCRIEPVQPGSRRPSRYRRHAGPAGVPPLPQPPYLVELVVWEETRSALQLPELLEPALGPNPPDTTLRTVVRFRLRTREKLPDDSDVTEDCDRSEIAALFEAANRQVLGDHSARPRLVARAHTPDQPESDASDLPIEQGYRGPENQLYRVEVHNGGKAGEATFKWSRDNGSVMFGLAATPARQLGDRAGMLVQLAERPREHSMDLDEGDWIELCTDDRAPLGRAAPLLQVTAYDRGRGLVSLAGPDTPQGLIVDASRHPFLRRWDQRGDVDPEDNAITVPALGDPQLEGGFFPLEDGVQVQFADPDAAYKRGDYWVIPARSTTGSVLWPSSHDGRPLAVFASRPVLYKAPLAIVTEAGRRPVDLRGSHWLANRVLDEDVRLIGTQRTDGTFDIRVQRPKVGGGPDLTATPGPEEAEAGGLAADQTSTLTTPPASGAERGAPESTTAKHVVQLVVLLYDNDKEEEISIAAGTTFDCTPGRYLIGRTVVTGIQLHDSTVSRSHAILVVTRDSASIEDIGASPGHSESRNGTYVSRGDFKDEKVVERIPLQHGDVLRFGAVLMRIDFLAPA